MSLPASRPLICLITHGEQLAVKLRAAPEAVADALVDQAAEAARAGVDLIQVRELDLDAAPLVALVSRIVRAAEGTGARIVVNDRLDVALAAGAHGVHLRGDSYPSARVRALAPPAFLVGRSVHSADEAAAVAEEGAVDYLVFGTVFASASKPPGHRPAGLDALARVIERARPLPVLAIGGVTVASMPLVAAAGAAGAAAIGVFLPGQGGARPLVDLVAGLRRAFDSVGDIH